MVLGAAEDAAARKQTNSLSQVLLMLGEVCLLAGRLEEATDAATRALDHFRRQQEKGHEAWALRLLGEIAARQAPAIPGLAEAHYQAAMTLAAKLEMLPLTARCELGLAGLLRRSGQSERAVQMLVHARIRFEELGMRADLTRVEGEVGAKGG